MENKSPLTCIINIKATLSKITSPYMMEVCELIYKLPGDTSPVVMEDCVNNNLDDITRKYLNEINDIGVDEDVWENKFIEN